MDGRRAAEEAGRRTRQAFRRLFPSTDATRRVLALAVIVLALLFAIEGMWLRRRAASAPRPPIPQPPTARSAP